VFVRSGEKAIGEMREHKRAYGTFVTNYIEPLAGLDSTFQHRIKPLVKERIVNPKEES
jgi:hypothetical protein